MILWIGISMACHGKGSICYAIVPDSVSMAKKIRLPVLSPVLDLRGNRIGFFDANATTVSPDESIAIRRQEDRAPAAALQQASAWPPWLGSLEFVQ